ncbi:MAG: efflux RND transporter permease subunit, partial [Bacteroidota bacterium]
FGISLNQLSIVGLVVALGLLVDDSIVVVENIERWLREGYSRKEAAIKGTQQITEAVIGTTATLVISFLPLVFLPGGPGEFVRGLPLAVISSVIASSVVALTLVPFLASRILSDKTHPEGNAIMRGLKRIIQATYSKLVRWSLRHTLLTLLIGFGLFGLSLLLVPVIGFKLFPVSEKPIFLIDAQMPDQTSVQRSDEIARMIEDSLASETLITNVTTNVGKGNPRIYYNVPQQKEKRDFAQFFVQLQTDASPQQKTDLIAKLQDRFRYFPYAKVEIEDFVQGPPITSPIELRIFGDDETELKRVSADIATMLADIPGSVYVENDLALPKTDIKVSIDRTRARSLGLATATIDQTIRLATAGLNVGTYTDKQDEDYPIILTTTDQDYPQLTALEEVYVNNQQGVPVALDQFTQLEFESSAKSINRFDKKRFARITANTENGVLANDVLAELLPQLDTYDFPAGSYYRLGGEAESEGDAFGGNFLIVVILSIFLFLAVLILQFKTFKGTIIVLSVIPLGVVGGVSMLFLTGNPMSFVAILGFIGLAGIEVKNSILLVDFTNQLRAEGMELNAAIELAGDLRFVPVLLTAVTAIGGLTPLAVSANPLISPLALVLIGGLVSSTLLSRVITPVMYKVLPPQVELT